jgi:hypothetical protein
VLSVCFRPVSRYDWSMESNTPRQKSQSVQHAIARLLATENINVLHKGGLSTAYFDLKNRTVNLPVWRDVTDSVYDLLISHEVGHARWTPREAWHNSIEKMGKPFFGYLNICEDARIEKMIKREYPGLHRQHFLGYSELLKRGFFNPPGAPPDYINAKNVSKMLLADRVNLHLKCRSAVPVSFNKIEARLVKELESVETFEQVYQIAKKMFGLDKLQREKRIAEAQELQKKLDELKKLAEMPKSLEEMTAGDEESESSEAGDEESEATVGNGDGDVLGDELSDAEVDEKLLAAGDEDDTDAPQSETEEAFRANEESLVDKGAGQWANNRIVKVPHFKLNEFVVPASKVLPACQHFYANEGRDYDNEYRDKEYTTWMTNSRRSVNQMVSEFMMRQNAAQSARAGSHKTGKLDMKTIHKYRTSGDLFKRIVRVPEGQSHGMIVYFDQSSSIHSMYHKMIEQMIMLAEFCKRLSIPFDFYGFSNSYCSRIKFLESNATEVQVNASDFNVSLSRRDVHLKQYVSSSMSNAVYKEAIRNLWNMRFNRPEFEHFNTTPLNSTLALSGQMVNEFTAKHGVDVVDVVVLTDGDATDSMTNGLHVRWAWNGVMTPDFAYVDTRSTTFELASLMSKATGANYILLFLAEKATAARARKNGIDSGNQKYTFAKHGFICDKTTGFDSYFMLRDLSSKVNSKTAGINKSMSASAMAREFSNNARELSARKLFLTVFATQLAEGKKAA